MSHLNRVVVLVDMDCFYCQVEERLDPTLKGKPMAVVQYNAWKGGGIIAVNYPARSRGVTRHMRGDEARQKCPEIELVRVPTKGGKADLTKYRDAGKEVARILQRFTPLLERASVDEAYLDITESVQNRLDVLSKEITLGEIKNTHVAACDTMDFLYNLYNSGLHVESNLKLAVGAVIAEEVRAAVLKEAGYTCSAGIAHNKILAKLAAGLNKPNKQTILPQDNVQELYKNLPVRKIRSLGGKFGTTLSEDLGITTMAELYRFSEKELTRRYDEKTASFLYNIARGIHYDPVTIRLIAKSIGCCKKFPGKSALVDVDSVKHWLNELSVEIAERLENDLEENNRKAKQIVVGFTQEVNGKNITSSRTHPLSSYEPAKIASEAYDVLKRYCMRPSGTFCIKYLGLNVGKFENCKNVSEITTFFKTDEGTSNVNRNVNKEKSETLTIKSFLKNQEIQQQGEDSDELFSDSDVDIKKDSKTNESPLDRLLNNFEERTVNNFSDTTVEADENSSEFKFLNEDENSSKDSITNELSGNNAKEKTVEKQEETKSPEKESFFLRYFENLRKKQKSPVVRDFNTSRNLEQNEENSIDNDDDEEEDHEDSNEDKTINTVQQNIPYDLPGTSKDFSNFEQAFEVCSECNKKINKTEMISHMDYHLALKIVREESHLYKHQQPSSTSTTAQKPSKVEVKKGGKRKFSEVENNTTLNEFFKAKTAEEDNSDDNTQLCPECNKRISIASFPSHLDYHAAKKLHIEINSTVKSCATESLKRNRTKSNERIMKDTKQSKSSVPSVMSFFKPVN